MRLWGVIHMIYCEEVGAKVIGCLINNPNLSIDQKYNLSVDDFKPNFFHQTLFISIHNLALGGITTITALEIADYLKDKSSKYTDVLMDNDYINFISVASQLARNENVDYYINTLKKRSLLRAYKEIGVPIKCVYDENSKTIANENKKLDDETIETISHKIQNQLVEVNDKFAISNGIEELTASMDFMLTKNKFKNEPLYGLPFTSNYLNTIIRGAVPGQLNVVSAPSGVGKTTFMSAIMANVVANEMCIDGIWVKNKHKMANAGLYIQFELDNETELLPKFLSYITGVGCGKILDGDWTDAEDEILNHGIKVMEESNIHCVCMPNFTVADIRATIRKYVYEHDVDFVVYDYIQESGSLNGELSRQNGGVSMRTDQVLTTLATELKNMAREFNIPILSATQTNRNIDDAPIKDASVVAGSRSLVNKVDNGFILTRATKKELEETESMARKRGFNQVRPTHIFHVHKSRFSSFPANLKVFFYWDMSTGRVQDMYVCDAINQPYPIKNIKLIEVEE